MNLRLPILLTLTSLIVASCAPESHTEKGSGASINFATHITTRGSNLIGASGLADKGGFKIWAYSHDDKWNTNPDKTALMDNVTVTGAAGGTVWNYGEPMNWPENKYVSFFAYGPTTNAATLNAETAQGKPMIDFTVTATAASQVDLLIASPVYDQLGVMYSTDRSVGIHFNHALSRINFSAMRLNTNSEDKREINVKEIRLNGLYSKATAPLASPVEWTLDNTVTASYTVNVSTSTLTEVELTEKPEDISTATGQLFLLPQQLAREEGKDPTMDVTLQIVENEKSSEMKYNSVVFSPTTWEAGKSYNYQIVVDGNDLKVILIDSNLELAPWGASIMVQPISLNKPSYGENATETDITNAIALVKSKDEARIHSALKAFGVLNGENLAENVNNNVKYYAIYLRNDVAHDVVIDMDAYNDKFITGEQIIFDIEKLITSWGKDGETYYKFEVTYDNSKWKLMDARQPYDPNNLGTPKVDGITSATTNNLNANKPNPLQPVGLIRNKGSIILERL